MSNSNFAGQPKQAEVSTKDLLKKRPINKSLESVAEKRVTVNLAYNVPVGTGVFLSVIYEIRITRISYFVRYTYIPYFVCYRHKPYFVRYMYTVNCSIYT